MADTDTVWDVETTQVLRCKRAALNLVVEMEAAISVIRHTALYAESLPVLMGKLDKARALYQELEEI